MTSVIDSGSTMEHMNKLIVQSEAKLKTNIKTLEDYVIMVTGIETKIGLSVKSSNSIEVYSTIINFSETVKSWCNYRNCISNEDYILVCKITNANIAIVSIEVRDSIGKNICYNKNGIILYKIFKRQLEPDGKYRKRTVGYIIEKVEKSRIIHIKTFDCTEKSKAKKLYKELVERENLQCKGDLVQMN